MRKVDYLMIFICALAAALCGAGQPLSAPLFVFSSSLGLVDSVKKECYPPRLSTEFFLP